MKWLGEREWVDGTRRNFIWLPFLKPITPGPFFDYPFCRAITCEGCKGFFRRVCQVHLKHYCMEDGWGLLEWEAEHPYTFTYTYVFSAQSELHVPGARALRNQQEHTEHLPTLSAAQVPGEWDERRLYGSFFLCFKHEKPCTVTAFLINFFVFL